LTAIAVQGERLTGGAMLTRETILQSLSREMPLLRDRYSVERLGLFGSFARADGTAGSDLDFLVVLHEPTFDHYMDLKFYLEDLFGRSVDLVIEDSLKPRLRPYVLREVVYAA
jgi:hypothetical protein